MPTVRRKKKAILIQAIPFLVALLVFLLVELGSGHPRWVETVYSRGIYPFIAALFSSLSQWSPISLWDLFWTLLIVALLILLGLALSGKMNRWRSLLRLFQFAALLYAFFYVSWGFNYFRQPFEDRVGWKLPLNREAPFATVLDTLINQANRSRTEWTGKDYPAIDSLIEAGYGQYAGKFGYAYPNGSRRPKTMLYTWFFAKSGISGYFGPFFNEVHLNGELLPTEYPFVLAHEKAHQFGFSGEAEANFMAWYICANSPDNRLRYSASIQLLQYFFADPSHHDEIVEYLKRFDKKAMADIMKQRSHWKALRNETIDKAQTRANNVYLKSNKIHEGVMNYNSVVKLTLEWYVNEIQPT
ncbi:MAG: DUF3810 domain-containing protein, partial [Marinilabiliales bacterium]|nr:DUF3810 domain-containing protein [Marinilabiliales bacterium]